MKSQSHERNRGINTNETGRYFTYNSIFVQFFVPNIIREYTNLPTSTQHVAYANNAIRHPAYQEGNIHPDYQVANFLLSFLRHAFNDFRSCYSSLLKLSKKSKFK